MKPKLSPWAEQDLISIFDYTLETWGESQFLKYRALLQHGFDEIAAHPLSPRSKSREELFPGCRSLHVGQHLILYRVKENTVEVARILHGSMEMERHIPSEFHT